MTRDLRLVSLVLAAIALPAALAGATGEADPAYAALRAARPQGSGLAVANLTLKRDVLELQFSSGTFAPLPAVEGRVWGAVFVGQGTLKLSPASEAERRQLALVTGETGFQALTEPFENLVLLFTDGTFQEIEKGATPAAAPSGAGAVFEDFFQKERKTLKTNLHLRVLGDLLRKADPGDGLLLAFVPGKKYPAMLAAVDPAGLDWASTGLGGETTALLTVENEGSIWYSSASKATLDAGKASPLRALARAEHYAIETEIRSNSEIRGTTTIRFQPLSAGLRVLPLHLLPKLRIREASFAAAESGPWTAAAVIQEADKEDADAGVVFPAPLAPGQPVWLRVAYDGRDVLHAAGEGNFVVEARESWYPNLATFTETATFDLTFRCPKAYDVVSIGSSVENRVDGDSRVTRWKSGHSIRVAGFNYGKFRRLERADKDSGMKVEVYTNPGTPDIVREINGLLSARSGSGVGLATGPGSPMDYQGAGVGLNSLHVDTEGLADSAMADGINTVRVCSRFFGALPDTRLAITQQSQWSFGQSWPSLVFLPFLAALDGTTRREFGLKDTADFIELVGPHEVAHQWWGHLVGWQNYRDQWLSEGFAEFSASLVLEIGGGPKKIHDFWERTRRQIIARPPQSAVTNDQAGAMTQGWRLATKRSPGAYQAMVYGKGAYVLHMLQLMMRETGAGADANFIAIMRDFVKSYAGKNPSTRDFQTVVERHMVPNMNGGGDGKMDWFFRQWVYGTEIPRYREKLEVAKTGDGQYRVTGTVAQEGVSADFRALTHIYLDYGKGEIAHLGLLPMIGSSTRPVDVTVKLAKPPKRAFLNANHDVLTRD